MKDIELLRIALPSDVESAKNNGSFEEALDLIRRYTEDPLTPEIMKRRLAVETEVISRIEREYPYTFAEGLSLVQKEIPDFSAEELQDYIRMGAALTHRIRYEKKLHHLFFDSMKKVYPQIAERTGHPHQRNVLLNDMIAHMKEKGSCTMRMRMRTELRLPDDISFEKLRVHIPLPAKAPNCGNIQILSCSPGGIIDDEDSLMRTVCFETEDSSRRSFSIEYSYECTARYVHPEGNGTSVRNDHDLDEMEPQIVFTPLIRNLCEELTGHLDEPLAKARAIYDFVTKNLVYAFVPEYMTLGCIPDFAASYRKGDCGIQALLFIVLCRCAGIPARWQSGMYVTPDHAGSHDWAMFEIEPYGWLWADCSFGGAAWRAGETERHDFYFGNLDPYRLVTSNDLQQEFAVKKEQWRIDPYDNQTGEIETESRGLKRHEFDSVTELLEMKEII